MGKRVDVIQLTNTADNLVLNTNVGNVVTWARMEGHAKARWRNRSNEEHFGGGE